MVELLYKELTFAVIGAAMEVHKILGPGFLEAVYQGALERELTLRGIPFEHQVKLPVTYKDILVGEYVADLFGLTWIDLQLVDDMETVVPDTRANGRTATGRWSLVESWQTVAS